MFVRSETDKRRVVIVDFSHMAWAYAFGSATALSTTLTINGVPRVIDTTIPANAIRVINRWAKGGSNPTAVCFDGKGATKCRKAYFAKLTGVTESGEAQGYKAKREPMDGKFYDGINLTMNYLYRGGVCCYKAEGYEADDLIKACVDMAKRDYPNLPIDVITGDSDLLPLVDEQVSVFIRSRTTTWAESKDIEKRHYFQVTPFNYESYVSGLNAFKNIPVPYNTVLLAKLLRGDKGDGIAGKSDWKPKQYKMLLDILNQQGYSVEKLFRYGNPTETICYRATEVPVPLDLISSTPKEQMMIKYGEPKELTAICDAFKDIVEPDDLVHIRNIYNGINLNGAFTGLGDMFNRKPAKLSIPVKGYDVVKLQQVVSELRINIDVA